MMNMLLTALCDCGLAGAISLVLVPFLRALKAGQSIRDIGPTWHNYKAGTPMMGGLMFIFASLIILLVNLPKMQDYSVFFVMIMAMSFGFIGFLDDFTKMKYKRNLGLTSAQKAMLQLAMSAVFLYAMYKNGSMDTHLYIPFVNVSFMLHPIVYIFFAMFVMVGCDNAVNLTDGVDGLATGVTIPVAMFYMAVSAWYNRADLVVVSAALAGGLFAFLIYNFHPAKVFMGDTGSLFLGGMVCGLAFALNIPLVLPIIGLIYVLEVLSDIIQVVYFKKTGGKRFFRMAPLHHHLELGGWSEIKLFCVFSGLTLVLCCLAFLGVMNRYPM